MQLFQVKEDVDLQLFSQYCNQVRDSAIKRRLDFFLSGEQIYAMAISNCAYCGSEPKARQYSNGEVPLTGIDRMDSAQGYLASNCVPCCSVCNRMKGQMSVADLLLYVKRIGANLGISMPPWLNFNKPALPKHCVLRNYIFKKRAIRPHEFIRPMRSFWIPGPDLGGFFKEEIGGEVTSVKGFITPHRVKINMRKNSKNRNYV